MVSTEITSVDPTLTAIRSMSALEQFGQHAGRWTRHGARGVMAASPPFSGKHFIRRLQGNNVPHPCSTWISANFSYLISSGFSAIFHELFHALRRSVDCVP